VDDAPGLAKFGCEGSKANRKSDVACSGNHEEPYIYILGSRFMRSHIYIFFVLGSCSPSEMFCPDCATVLTVDGDWNESADVCTICTIDIYV
jgi:hypothetical protein